MLYNTIRIRDGDVIFPRSPWLLNGFFLSDPTGDDNNNNSEFGMRNTLPRQIIPHSAFRIPHSSFTLRVNLLYVGTDEH